MDCCSTTKNNNEMTHEESQGDKNKGSPWTTIVVALTFIALLVLSIFAF